MPKNYSDNDVLEILYNAVARSGEVGTSSAFTLQVAANYNSKTGEARVVGNSGYSLGLFQYDFGARSATDKKAILSLIDSYNAWAASNGQAALTSQEKGRLSDDLVAHGQALSGNVHDKTTHYMAPDDALRTKVNRFLTSDAGMQFVHTLDASVLNTSPGYRGLLPFAKQVAASPTIQNMSDKDGQCAIAALSKIFNQNHAVADGILKGLKGQSMDFRQFEAYVCSKIDHSGVSQSSKQSLHTGFAASVRGMQLIDDIRRSPTLGPLWSAAVSQDPSLENNFSRSPASQLFDAMLRNPAAGERMVAAIDSGKSALIPTSKGAAGETYVAGVTADGTLFTMDGHGTGQGYANGNWTAFADGGGLTGRDRHGQWALASRSDAEQIAANGNAPMLKTIDEHPLADAGTGNPTLSYFQLAAEVPETSEPFTTSQASNRSFRLQ
ncbi:hypothetical protein [Paraburkholderia sp. BCC1885]|uniref:hypothetical protein n=1 Tax=Paraburkholderia sp. BCC1885 TaxID=2562669 RepID=UPI001181CCA2|nr:hypothetical protein [Paraburkholderia sp. BCC1885]